MLDGVLSEAVDETVIFVSNNWVSDDVSLLIRSAGLLSSSDGKSDE